MMHVARWYQQAYEDDLFDWKQQYQDTDGNEMDEQEQYWRIPWLYSDDHFVPDDVDSLNDYLRENFEDAGNNRTYEDAVRELTDLEPYATLEQWEWPMEEFYPRYAEV